jgi:hypothetical protein
MPPPCNVRVIDSPPMSCSPSRSIHVSIAPDIVPLHSWMIKPDANQPKSEFSYQDRVTAQSDAASRLGSTSEPRRLRNTGISNPRTFRAQSRSMHARRIAQHPRGTLSTGFLAPTTMCFAPAEFFDAAVFCSALDQTCRGAGIFRWSCGLAGGVGLWLPSSEPPAPRDACSTSPASTRGRSGTTRYRLGASPFLEGLLIL